MLGAPVPKNVSLQFAELLCRNSGPVCTIRVQAKLSCSSTRTQQSTATRAHKKEGWLSPALAWYCERLEGEADAELAQQRTRLVGAGRVDEPDRLRERRRADIQSEVVAIVRPIRKVESLRDELQVHA